MYPHTHTHTHTHAYTNSKVRISLYMPAVLEFNEKVKSFTKLSAALEQNDC